MGHFQLWQLFWSTFWHAWERSTQRWTSMLQKDDCCRVTLLRRAKSPFTFVKLGDGCGTHGGGGGQTVNMSSAHSFHACLRKCFVSPLDSCFWICRRMSLSLQLIFHIQSAWGTVFHFWGGSDIFCPSRGKLKQRFPTWPLSSRFSSFVSCATFGKLFCQEGGGLFCHGSVADNWRSDDNLQVEMGIRKVWARGSVRLVLWGRNNFCTACTWFLTFSFLCAMFFYCKAWVLVNLRLSGAKNDRR